jgi:hypothetical protein
MQLIVAVIRRLCSFLLVLEKFLIIDDSHNRRSRICRDFDQVHAEASCEVESVIDRKDAELLSVVADDADFASFDFVVFANLCQM